MLAAKRQAAAAARRQAKAKAAAQEQADSDAAGKAFLGHGAAAVITLAAGITAGVYASRLTGVGAPLASWRQVLPPDGLVIMAISATWMLLGALLHTPIAGWRGARVAAGFRVIAWLLAYHLVVGLLAIPFADFAGGDDRGLSDYGWMLLSLLWLPALATAAGVWFIGPDEKDPEAPDLVGNFRVFTFNVLMLLSWALGWVFFSGILLENADRYALPPLIPPWSMSIVAVGFVVGLPSVLIYLLRRRFVAVLLWDQINPRHLFRAGLAVLVGSLVAAQVTRFVDPDVVQTVVFVFLVFFYTVILRYLHRRFPPPEDWDPLQ
ncbi:hypothetical protein SAMN04489716_0883 [Actinoplanes derwentensis]|uniref:Uncharacterized protein n=1 Tax=Actinoplanes derwentensis TaxID=113562 RepID=A0A1H1SKI9_9ACTN|nr:hypothetical protein Ade03nite_22040 [Actinoplanes derwentensis]SDS48358.1 hypothetical protein SAMN04489716_0883 [Actinoplanes derwentensis]